MPEALWKIKGMHCTSCESLIKDILTDHGIKTCALDANTGRLDFSYPEKINLDQIKKEIEKGGYVVSVWK